MLLVKKTQVLLKYKYDKKKKVALFTKIEETGWTVLVTLEQDVINSKSKPVLVQIFIVSILALVFIIIIGTIFASKIVRPINQLKSIMGKVKLGDFSIRADVVTKDEIGDMSEVFNEMLDNVTSLINGTKDAALSVNKSATLLETNSERAMISAKEVARTIQEIAEGANSQAEDAEKGARITSELNEEIEYLVNYILDMKEHADKVQNQNKLSNETVQLLNNRTKESTNATEKIGSSINVLKEKSNTIGNIVDTISMIAVKQIFWL